MALSAAHRIQGLERPVALALSGGGAQGAAQAGAAAELLTAGLVPDMVIGTSVGAWNGAWIAAHPGPQGADGLAGMWLDPQVRRLFRGLVLGYIGALARRRSSALPDARLRRLVDRLCGLTRFEDLALPLAVSAVDLLTAELVYIDHGGLADAVRAASAIPSVLPPVRIGDRLLSDAGFVDNFGVAEAVRRGARSVVLIDASVGVLATPPLRVAAILDRANLVTRIHQRRHAQGVADAAGVRLDVLEVAGRGRVLDFASAGTQLETGRQVGATWLACARGLSRTVVGCSQRGGRLGAHLTVRWSGRTSPASSARASCPPSASAPRS